MNEIRIRRRQPTDLAGCVAALAETHRDEGYPVHWPTDPRQFLTSGAQLESWVAVDGTGIVGHVTLGDAKVERDELLGTYELPPHLAGISRLFVTPARTGGGVGGLLLDTAVHHAAGLERAVVLSVVDDGLRRGAIAFYEKRGWRFITALPGDWRLPNGQPVMLRYYLAPERVSVNRPT